jgi:hypothetical protein
VLSATVDLALLIPRAKASACFAGSGVSGSLTLTSYEEAVYDRRPVVDLKA